MSLITRANPQLGLGHRLRANLVAENLQLSQRDQRAAGLEGRGQCCARFYTLALHLLNLLLGYTVPASHAKRQRSSVSNGRDLSRYEKRIAPYKGGT